MNLGFSSATSIAPNPERFNRKDRDLPLTHMGGKKGDTVAVKDLLDQAHKVGLAHISIDQLTVDWAAESAVCVATATFTDGTSFSDIGDASPASIANAYIRPHFPRMAATRAIGRALRSALNVAENAAEEMDGGDAPRSASRPAASAAPRSAAAGPAMQPGDKTSRGLTVPPYNNQAGDGWLCEVSGEPIFGGGQYAAAERAAFSAAEFNGHIVGFKAKNDPRALAFKGGGGGDPF